MAVTQIFHLPDLGEGLPDATIVAWHVQEGDSVARDAALATLETAKAVVELPAPYGGKVIRLHGAAGDVIATGAPLVEFELAEAAPDGAAAPAAAGAHPDSATVVGALDSQSRDYVERPGSGDGARAVPAVRALAHKLKIDLAHVTPSGAGGVVTRADVERAAAARDAAAAQPPAPAAGHAAAPASGSDPFDQPAPLRGARRNMARAMAAAHASVVLTTTTDDADLHGWIGRQDITARLVRAIVAASRAVPALNAWLDGEQLTRTLHSHVDVGIAVDSADGLFVPVLRRAERLDAHAIRAALERLRAQVAERSITAADMTGATISLSNYGALGGGRYATPIVVPPAVAIVGVGRLQNDVVAELGGLAVHRRLPISLSFDHRGATGGDAARFLRALLEDLQLPT